MFMPVCVLQRKSKSMLDARRRHVQRAGEETFVAYREETRWETAQCNEDVHETQSRSKNDDHHGCVRTLTRYPCC